MATDSILQQAYNLWKQSKKQEADSQPVCIEALRFSKGLSDTEKQKWLNHMPDCAECRELWIESLKHQEHYEMMKAHNEQINVKMASRKDKFKNVLKIDVWSGKAVITFRKSLEQEDTCSVTFRIEDNSGAYDGKRLTVFDKNYRRILDGTINYSTISQDIHDLDNIDYSEIEVMLYE